MLKSRCFKCESPKTVMWQKLERTVKAVKGSKTVCSMLLNIR